jgi:cytochrome c oxidase subunit 3
MSETTSLPPSPWTNVRLAVGSTGRSGLGWPGIGTVIATEGALFVFLLFAYFYFDFQLGPEWRPRLPEYKLAVPNTIVLLVSSAAMSMAEHAAKRGARGQVLAGTGMAFGLGVIFVAVQIQEWLAKPFTPSSNLYGSVYFTITGFHMAHVAVGLAVLAAMFVWSLLGYFDARRHTPILIGAAYWHFVDVVWLAVFFTFYITPLLWWQ